MPICNAVFQGGGVKGTGFAGAVVELEDAGYQFESLAGTSAGAIVAALLAVGYTGAEICEELARVDYDKFLDSPCVFVKKSNVAKVLNIARKWGIYSADAFEAWLSGLLAKKGKLYFRDIRIASQNGKRRYKFQAIASDITDKKMLLLPGDLAAFGIEPDDFPIATAVRMSMTIPFYFEPYKLCVDGTTRVILDGGLLSNYPIWVLDDGGSNPQTPTFGFKFGGASAGTNRRKHDNNIIGFTKAIVTTLLDAWDNWHISESSGDFARTILISTEVAAYGKRRNVSTTDFNISESEKVQLLENGKVAAQKFLANWNFTDWKREFRA